MIGSVVGNYKITEKIGEGGMGSVFKGVDLMLEREVAIKMLRPELSSQPQVVERFRTEAVTLARLNHPNIATLFSFLRHGENYFMVMEFVRGETLDSYLHRYSAMVPERAIALFCHALEGIDHAHRLGIIHRDIKPANMMLTESGSIKVMDFGIARVLGSARMTKQGNIVGTIEYMSPEQVRGQEGDARSDIYALGILLYEMLTGRVPFNGDSDFEIMKAHIEAAPPPPRAFAAQIPLPVEGAIMRALAKKPEARFQSVAELRAILVNNLGAVTNALEGTQGTYAAPATRLSGPVAAPRTIPDVVKETTLGVDARAGGMTGADQIKETRLGQAGDPTGRNATPYPPPGYGTGAQATPGQAAPQPGMAGAPTQLSLLSKLNWKHYAAAAAAALVLLVSVPLALINLTGGPKSPGRSPANGKSNVSPQGAAQSIDQNATPTSNPGADASSQPVIQPVGPDTRVVAPASPLDPNPAAEAGVKPMRARGRAADAAQPGQPAESRAATPRPPDKSEEKKDEKKGGFFHKLKNATIDKATDALKKKP